MKEIRVARVTKIDQRAIGLSQSFHLRPFRDVAQMMKNVKARRALHMRATDAQHRQNSSPPGAICDR